MTSKGSLFVGDESVEEVFRKGPPEYAQRMNAGIRNQMKLMSSVTTVG